MSRREVARGDYPLPPPSKCAKVLYYTWKLCSVVFSHFVMISLVVAYCILGAVTFEKLEAEYEREVKMNISHIRNNTSQSIWLMTNRSAVLVDTNWTSDVIDILKDFENSILLEMKVRGWDGNEDPERLQWTFTGALFYSIIVITTIGYGHIAPKTQSGKVVTIFYAILGIPLMLLTLSNIGDVMASSFRFLYWRVCCYVCTRPPKRSHRRHHTSNRRSVRGGSGKGSTRRKRPPPLERAHSDTDCRYRDSGYSSGQLRRPRPTAQTHTLPPPRTRSQPPHAKTYGQIPYEKERSPAQYERYGRDNFDEPLSEFPKISLPLQDLAAALKDLDEHQVKLSNQASRSKSLPRPAKSKPDYGPKRDFEDYRHFEDDQEFYEMHDLHDVDYENYKERRAREFEDRGKRDRDERDGRRDRDEREDFYGCRDRGYDPEDDDYEFDSPRTRRSWHDRDHRYNRGRSEYYERERDEQAERHGRRARSAACEGERRAVDDRAPEPGRQRRLRRLHTVDDSRMPYQYTPSPERDDWSDDVAVSSRRNRPPGWELHSIPPEPSKEEIKPVPIWLCVFLVASYIVAGTFLFKSWEGWAYLDAAYFCFITLTTIGFGDFVPAQGQSHVANGNAADAVHSIALCSLYLLFGIALLAMSFNLVQEEVRANVASLATKLGIIKSKQVDSESEE